VGHGAHPTDLVIPSENPNGSAPTPEEAETRNRDDASPGAEARRRNVGVVRGANPPRRPRRSSDV
jgi:hypothetical protein